MTEKSYEEEYNEFWKDIVENEDGTLNKDQVMRELSDYSMVMDNCAKAYYTMTNGLISKQNTCFDVVENKFYENFISKDDDLIYGYLDDFVDILNDAETLEELKEELEKYFGILNKGSESDE